MKPSEQLAIATRIAHLRALQLSRARAETRRLADAREAAQACERDASNRLAAIAQDAQSGSARTRLPIDLLRNRAGAIDTAHRAWMTTAGQARAAAGQVDAHRPTLERHQQCADAADTLVARARIAERRARDKADDAQLEIWLSTRRRHP
ncbi:hypothetical protein WL40_02060 [Burkholderia ubonensis]|uniref:Flagellar FliJ protein n=1 Tax=Burkholderia ubonensis TaxID=101571 RepID=A0ABD6Q705_9BURK|nr:hypothetical protein [Burkholderia ubonensis]KVC83864.1 hypothetical protein WI74_02430 [Burkholderia ubonensis]KVO18848.1 hypothetical protein WJ72_06385 [Burkholderia ubonensis]KVO19553.1 hypothetical protein WJ74_05575 [Burkholderia ubonensis]KVO33814.1 hypothetical protein WJ76_14405 [Burkholderia ubonensis]KVP19081.1 hypothetical protein WJ85_08480 [Burkholderia ubonensis]